MRASRTPDRSHGAPCRRACRGDSSALKRSQGAGAVLKNISEDFRLLVVQETEEGDERTISLEPDGEASGPVVRLVNTLLLDALAKRASDIHIETYDQGVVVKYRIDGVLYPATQPLDRRYHAALISRLKVMGDLNIAEKRVPQDGRFKLRNGQRDIDFRISVIPCAFGEDVVVRILDKTSLKEGASLRLETVGMAPEVLKRFRRSIHEPYGMVLITGPTGSGKTTTLYAALSELNAGEEKSSRSKTRSSISSRASSRFRSTKEGSTFARGRRSCATIRTRSWSEKSATSRLRRSPSSRLTGHLVFHYGACQQRLRRHQPLHQHGGRRACLRLSAQSSRSGSSAPSARAANGRRRPMPHCSSARSERRRARQSRLV